MTFRCEDLRDFGLILVPPSSPDYDPLLKDIRQRIVPDPDIAGMPEMFREVMGRFMGSQITPEKRATSAILLNRSDKSIAALSLVWHYEEAGGRTEERPWKNLFGRALLLPFGYSPESLKIEAYRNTILPGSRRYIGEYEMAGDNTDVRLPDPDEVKNGWAFSGYINGPWIPGGPAPVIESVTLVIDGVFFADGAFAGPDRRGLWDEVTSEARSKMEVATIARDGNDRGIPAAEILKQIGKGSQDAKQLRQHLGDQHTVDHLAAGADTKLPDFRKL